MAANRNRVKSLIGKHVYIKTRQGQVFEGILDKFDRNKVYLRSNAKPVTTSAFFNPVFNSGFNPFFNPFFNEIVLFPFFDVDIIEEPPFFFNNRIFF